MIPVVSVVGKSNVGKTTFLEKLIAELKARGYRVAVIKHNVHDFEIDHPGKDTYRHAKAGADTVIIASARKMAMIKKLDEELPIQNIVELAGAGHDLIITEGYKHGPFPKIEVSRKEVSGELICSEDELIALVTDNLFSSDIPHFSLDDAGGLAKFLEQRFLRQDRREGQNERAYR